LGPGGVRKAAAIQHDHGHPKAETATKQQCPGKRGGRRMLSTRHRRHAALRIQAPVAFRPAVALAGPKPRAA